MDGALGQAAKEGSQPFSPFKFKVDVLCVLTLLPAATAEPRDPCTGMLPSGP